MAKDWADRRAEHLVKTECDQHGFPDGIDDLRRMLAGAIREALEKAAEAVEEEQLGDDLDNESDHAYRAAIRDAVKAIRALGAK